MKTDAQMRADRRSELAVVRGVTDRPRLAC